MQRPRSAIDRPRRRDLLRLPPSVETQAKGFAPDARVVKAVDRYKEFLRDNVEVRSDPIRRHLDRQRRPETASLKAHATLWTKSVVQDKVDRADRLNNRARLASGRAPKAAKRPASATQRSTMRQLYTFDIKHDADEDADPEEDDHSMIAMRAEREKMAQLEKHGAAAASSGQRMMAGGVIRKSHQRTRPVAAEVPPDGVALRYILAMQALTEAVHRHPRSVIRKLVSVLNSGDGVESIKHNGHELQVIRRRTFVDRVSNILLTMPQHLPGNVSVPDPSPSTTPRAVDIPHAGSQNASRQFSGPPSLAGTLRSSQPTTPQSAPVKPAKGSVLERAVDRAAAQFRDVFEALNLNKEGWVAWKPLVAGLHYANEPSGKALVAYFLTALSVHDSPFHVADQHALAQFTRTQLIPTATAAMGRIPFARAAVNPNYVPPPPPRPLSETEKVSSMWGSGKDRWSTQADPVIVELEHLGEVLFSAKYNQPDPNRIPDTDEHGNELPPPATPEWLSWKDARAKITAHCPALMDILVEQLLS